MTDLQRDARCSRDESAQKRPLLIRSRSGTVRRVESGHPSTRSAFT